MRERVSNFWPPGHLYDLALRSPAHRLKREQSPLSASRPSLAHLGSSGFPVVVELAGSLLVGALVVVLLLGCSLLAPVGVELASGAPVVGVVGAAELLGASDAVAGELAPVVLDALLVGVVELGLPIVGSLEPGAGEEVASAAGAALLVAAGVLAAGELASGAGVLLALGAPVLPGVGAN